LLDLVGGLDDQTSGQGVVNLAWEAKINLVLLIRDTDKVYEITTDEEIE